jgi:hypothetical protein
MGDDAVIPNGVETPEARSSLYPTVHGAERRFARAEMDAWLYRHVACLSQAAGIVQDLARADSF